MRPRDRIKKAPFLAPVGPCSEEAGIWGIEWKGSDRGNRNYGNRLGRVYGGVIGVEAKNIYWALGFCALESREEIGAAD